MKSLIILMLLYSILCITTSCDKIKPPFKEAITPQDSDNDTELYFQKVLIEDFTGAKCGNCPKAHDAIEQLKTLYPGKIISIGIHSGFDAVPNSPPYTTYTYDFRTQVGNELTAFFNPNAIYPSGLINREESGGSWDFLYPDWPNIIDTLLKKPPKIEMEISNIYDTTSRILQSTIKSDILLTFSATLKISVYITEDSIIAWQTDYRFTPPDIRNYVHRHVLRDAMNGTWGDLFSTGTIQAGKSFRNIYSYTLKSNWNAKHCSVVAFIYNDATKEIIQVEEQDKLYLLLQ